MDNMDNNLIDTLINQEVSRLRGNIRQRLQHVYTDTTSIDYEFINNNLSEELCMNLYDSLQDVFKILEKNGIKFD